MEAVRCECWQCYCPARHPSIRRHTTRICGERMKHDHSANQTGFLDKMGIEMDNSMGIDKKQAKTDISMKSIS
jgi:hypothetical protein